MLSSPRLADFWKKRNRRHLLVLAVVVATCLLAGFGTFFVVKYSQGRHHWRQAEEALAEFDFERAREHLGAFLEIQPDSAEGHLLFAMACRRAREEDFAQAQTHLAEAKRLKGPEKALAVENRLLDFQKSGTADTREAILHQYLDNPALDHPRVLEALARGCLRADRVNDAAAWFDRWVESYPNDWYARLWRGTLLQHMDRPELAVADFECVLAQKPGSVDVERRLGLALVQSGSDYLRALRLLEGYRQSHPEDVDALVGVARCLCVLNQPDAARALLRSVLAVDPDHPDALLAKALVESAQENDREALQCLQRLEPLVRSLQTEKAFQRLLRLEPVADGSSVPTRLRTVYHLLATVLRRLGQEPEALSYEQKLKQLEADVAELLKASQDQPKNPNDVGLWYRLGLLNLRAGMKENGEYWLQRVLQANPSDRRAHQALADFYRGLAGQEFQRKADWHQQLADSDR